jgi:hypothetical protein
MILRVEAVNITSRLLLCLARYLVYLYHFFFSFYQLGWSYWELSCLEFLLLIFMKHLETFCLDVDSCFS